MTVKDPDLESDTSPFTAEDSQLHDELLKIETTGIEPVPSSERHGEAWELGGMWAGAFMNYTSLLTGSLLIGFGLGIIDSLAAIVVGASLAALILGLLSVSGPRSGVPQIVFSRRVFGYHGAYVPGALTLFLAVSWFAVDCVIATNALTQLFGILGVNTSQGLKVILLLVVVVLSILVAIYGHQTVIVFERYGAAIFLVFCVILFVALAPKVQWQLASSVHGTTHFGAWILGASVVFALVASWFSFAADYSRYLPARTGSRSVVGWVTAGAALPAATLGMLGVLLFSIDPKTGDLLTTIVRNTSRPLSIAFLLFVALGMIWANYLDVYTAGLVALALDIRLRRWQTALFAGILGGFLAYYALFVSSFLTAYTNFLLVTYIWAPAWAAIVLLDLFFPSPNNDVARPSMAATPPSIDTSRRPWRILIRWPALSALVTGTASAIPFVNSTLWQSPLSTAYLHGADLSGFISFLIGGVVFWLLSRTKSLAHNAVPQD